MAFTAEGRGQPKSKFMTDARSVSTRSLPSVVLDEVMAWTLTQMRRRASRRGYFGGIVAPVDDLIGQRIVATGAFEATQIDAVRRLIEQPEFLGAKVRRDGVFVDVGANIGVYCLAFARCFARALAIEAHPTTFAVLTANLALKRLGNVTPICAAASDRGGEAEIQVPINGNLGWAALEAHDKLERTGQRVVCRPLDEIIQEHANEAHVALVKIDVEGHEPQVLEGARETLARDRPVVLFEASCDNGGRCASLLRSLGYSRFFRFRRAGDFAWRTLTDGLGVCAVPVEPECIGRAALICAVAD